MAEDFQARICGSNWWNLSKAVLAGGAPPFLAGYNDVGSYGWSANDLVDVKGMFYEEPISVSGNSLDFVSVEKALKLDSVAGGGSMLMDSDSLTMGFGLSSSPTVDWNQTLLNSGNGRTERTLKSFFEENMGINVNYQQEEPIRINDRRSARIQKDWSPNNFSTISEDDNSIDYSFKSVAQDSYTDQGRLHSNILSGDSQNFSAGFTVGSTSYGHPSTLFLQTLPNPQTQQSSFLANNRSINSSSSANFGINSEESSSSWPEVPSIYPKPSRQQHKNGSLYFSDNTSFWNSSSSTKNNIRAGLSPSAEKPKSYNLATTKLQLYTGEGVQVLGTVAKRSNGGGTDLVFKRPRIETPSPLPTFKVRKEKLGDRITALQQLVSPFGKTDTASVLHEAIEYIKFLHDQVTVLSTPYMKSGASIQHQEVSEKLKETEVATHELRNRGLCLVPISSTFAAANETTPEFWTPTFGGTFK